MTMKCKILENNQQKSWGQLNNLHNAHKLEMYTILDSNENATLLCLMPMKENVIILNVEGIIGKVLHVIWRLIFF